MYWSIVQELNLHKTPQQCKQCKQCRPATEDLTIQKLVPLEGLEPPRLSTADSKSAASTNSTTGA